MEFSRDQDGIITSCKFYLHFSFTFFISYKMFLVIQVYNRLSRRGLFVRIDTTLGEWEIVPMDRIPARDYFNLVLVNGGRDYRDLRRTRSRSPLRRWYLSPESPPHSSSGSSLYSRASSRASPDLYSEDDEDDDGIGSDSGHRSSRRSPDRKSVV